MPLDDLLGDDSLLKEDAPLEKGTMHHQCRQQHRNTNPPCAPLARLATACANEVLARRVGIACSLAQEECLGGVHEEYQVLWLLVCSLQVVELATVAWHGCGKLGIHGKAGASNNGANDPVSGGRRGSACWHARLGLHTHSRLMPTEPLCERSVDVVANTPVPTIRLTIKKAAEMTPMCRPWGSSDTESPSTRASASSACPTCSLALSCSEPLLVSKLWLSSRIEDMAAASRVKGGCDVWMEEDGRKGEAA